MIKFRTLTADEIEVRVATANKSSGISLLLYKDARADMIILDETVGAENWQRKHTRDNANCIVSIWDADKKQWIEKEDTGTESNTEKEKGQASDSFKRACVNWGIGRELYTSPFIWIANNSRYFSDIEWYSKNGKEYPKSNFEVTEIEYSDKRKITKLAISYNGKPVYTYGIKDYTPDPQKPPAPQNPVPPEQSGNASKLTIDTIEELCKRTKTSRESLLKYLKVDDFSQLSETRAQVAIERLKGKLNEGN